MRAAETGGIVDAAEAEIVQLSATVYRYPIDTPVVTSFGIMHDRPMVLIRAEDRDGAIGWGEVWCNFPMIGAEYRARMVDRVLAPMVLGRRFADPAEIFAYLTERSAVLALQSGEPGPIAQCIAGIDIALWDLAARRARMPLWRLLGGGDPQVTVYASGLNPDAPDRIAADRRGEGYRAFKLKIGFGADRDLGNLRTLRQELGAGAMMMVDANQAWSPEQAARQAPALEPFALRWLEEPLRADRPWSDWLALANHVSVPLAAGENVSGEAGFADLLAAKAVEFVQPDIAKWGGFSGCLPVARRILAAGRVFCPHWLGGGIGLLASAHLLAALGGDGMLEIDANPNPLRTLTCGALANVVDGRARLGDQPGLGDAPDEMTIRPFKVPH